MAPGDALSIYGHRTRLLTGLSDSHPGPAARKIEWASAWSIVCVTRFLIPFIDPRTLFRSSIFYNKHRRRRSSFFYRREVLLSWIVRGSKSRVCNGDNRTTINFYTIIFVNCKLFAEASNEWIVKTIELKGSIMNYVRFIRIKMFQHICLIIFTPPMIAVNYGVTYSFWK